MTPSVAGAQTGGSSLSFSASADGQFDWLADAAVHFHQGVDGEPGRLFVHHVGHTRTRNHQHLGRFGLLQMVLGNPGGQLVHQLLLSNWVSLICLREAVCKRLARSEEHTSELQSLMRNSYAVFCLTKKTRHSKRNPSDLNYL